MTTGIAAAARAAAATVRSRPLPPGRRARRERFEPLHQLLQAAGVRRRRTTLPWTHGDVETIFATSIPTMMVSMTTRPCLIELRDERPRRLSVDGTTAGHQAHPRSCKTQAFDAHPSPQHAPYAEVAAMRLTRGSEGAIDVECVAAPSPSNKSKAAPTLSPASGERGKRRRGSARVGSALRLTQPTSAR